MSKALDKLRKLLNQKKGEEALGNLAAAEAFAVKIQELLIKHKLELSDIESKAEDETNPITYVTIDPEAWGEERLPKRIAWTEGLAHIIAGHYFCRGLALLECNAVLFVGRITDIEIASAVFCRIMRTGLNICEAELSGMLLKYPPETLLIARRLGVVVDNEDFRFSFFAGFNASIANRLDSERKRIVLNAGSQTALVRIEKGVDDFVDSQLKPEATPDEELNRRVSQEAFRLGAVYGARVEISPNRAKEALHD